MHNDNIYPNNGEAFYTRTPDDNKQAKAKKVEDTLAQLPLLKRQMERFDEKITATDSIKEAKAVAKAKGCSEEVALLAFDLIREFLEIERSFIAQNIKAVK